jgi:hypothetical protein
MLKKKIYEKELHPCSHLHNNNNGKKTTTLFSCFVDDGYGVANR